ncbi:GTPase ObgE [Columbia Basin potato purple top phytoplasma]|uniref:GTPase Obg n=1 Tax=Columbia Basin potato purple top phytoplasma TaxID=307134 RepID=A0ABT5L9C5_9MOLU|nr:GTPase ObgE [Columbia Basin potato purple top phytoplasma]MDC9032197.1 GTPase ObgE [Columbia Basin potato purple top phytoplasma]
MNFADESINFVKAGNGGNGIVSFRREKYVPYGGPSGGNGGAGGSVILIGDSGMNTLFKLQYQRKIIALNGSDGKNKTRNGSKAPDLFIKVPLGTLVYNNENNLFIGEIVQHGSQLIIAKGGKGGRGNYSLANSKNKAPSFAEKGELGESLVIRTELKILADVGLIGFPNVGKSSLISAISNVKSKIGSYSFTTLKPILGVVNNKDFSFTVADIPGLIKDSHLGKGMGINFLKHIERCKVLIYVFGASDDNIYDKYCQLREELKKYNSKILDKPQIILFNKMDLENAEKKLSLFKNNFADEQIIIACSVWNNFNLDYLKDEIKYLLIKHQSFTKDDNLFKNYKLFTLDDKDKFDIYKDNQGYFVIKNDKIEKLFHKTDLNNYESLKKFSYLLKKIGVEEKLKKNGMTYKDKVKICNCIFEFV